MDTTLLADLQTHRIEGITNLGNIPFSVPLYSHIIGNLWTGGCPVGAVPPEFQFVVCLYPWQAYSVPLETTHLKAMLYDTEDVPDPNVLHVLAEYVNAVTRIGKTLVHCQAGLNRSALVAALSLIHGGMTSEEAIKLMREKRCDAVLCNQAFESWLRQQ